MTNFDYYRGEPQFVRFADVAIAAEKIINIDPEACVLNCRRAMEFAVKWMYSVDRALVSPREGSLVNLLHTREFREIVDESLWQRLDFIRRMGNSAAHGGQKIGFSQAALVLRGLHTFFDFLACCYAGEYEEREFDPALLRETQEAAPAAAPLSAGPELQALLAENRSLKEELTKRRAAQAENYREKPLDFSEYQTRKIYIDSLLAEAGWREGVDWLNEVELPGMPNVGGTGFADYVLYDDAHRPLAVVEAKRTSADIAKGRQQAKLYADILEQMSGRRPVIFLTNGFETHIIDGKYPERPCAAIYSKRDLMRWFNLLAMRQDLEQVSIDRNIAGRYYQEAAVKAACLAFAKNRRKALLVMATGSGKTRTVIELCRVLLRKGWVSNILFLADRTSLVVQAKRAFVNLLPSLSCTNLLEERNYQAHAVFSTYNTMMNIIDAAKDEQGRVFSCGHFDLVICDEAHRSIYNKYRDIFTYFDALLVGLTATPKDEIDKNTYAVFELEKGMPTYGYDLSQAVVDGFLVNFVSLEGSTKFLEQGIHYDELSAEDRAAYEETFADEEGEVPESIAASALNSWLFNEDTIRKVLGTLMERGLKVDYGQKPGKTIIFAKNHAHAEKILEVFHREYPHLPDDFAQVIDNRIKYAQSLIDAFSEQGKLPQVAISVDMLDTGIDVPPILNLVFFKKVLSKAKFWQMIGRGTRLCPGLCDGRDKERFYIFDFCGNFEFFRVSQGQAAASALPLQGAIFILKFQLAAKLQEAAYQTPELIAFRKRLVQEMAAGVRALPRDNFAVRQHLRAVEQYAAEQGYQMLTEAEAKLAEAEIAPLLLPEADEVSAVRFDALLYGIELAHMLGRKRGKALRDLRRKAEGVSKAASIPEVQAKAGLVREILQTDYLERAGVQDFERIRTELRGLMKYLPHAQMRYDTDFNDEITRLDIHEGEPDTGLLGDYRERAAYYVRQHQDNAAIAKLRTNQPLTKADVKLLEDILWSEAGTEADYHREYGEKPLGEFVRSIVGLDMRAAKEAFAVFLNDASLDSRQIYFVNQIVEYIVQNGMLLDFAVLQKPPFTDQGSIVSIFKDLNVWSEIKKTIDKVNANAQVA